MTTADPGPTQRLGAFIAGQRRRPLEDGVAERARTALLDALALGLAARGDSALAAFISLTRELADPSDGCRIWGRKQTVSVLDGVTANALAVHARFQDDCDMISWSHPGSLIVPVAVGLGESLNADVSIVLQAIVCGYATLSWLGAREVVGRAIVNRGFRASPTLGTIAAAATASVLLSLDTTQARNAVAIAADVTGGLLEPVRTGAADWRIENATAAYRGTLAALLAARGVDGPATCLEGATGFLHAFAGMDEVPATWAVDPDERSILTVWAKPYPTLGDNMAVVATALSLREDGLASDRIRSVTVHQNAHFASYPGTAYRGPFTRPAQAMASTAFATAATLLYGPLRYKLYDTNLGDGAIAAMIERIRVVPESAYTYLDALVEVQSDDGSTVRRSASELPRTLFFRDRPTARTAFRALLAEGGYPEGFADQVPEMVFAPSGGPPQMIRSVIDAVTEGAR